MRHINRGRPVLSSKLSVLPDTLDSLIRGQGHQETLHTRLTSGNNLHSCVQRQVRIKEGVRLWSRHGGKAVCWASQRSTAASVSKPKSLLSSWFLSWSVQSAITEYQRLGVKQQVLFGQFWKLEAQGQGVSMAIHGADYYSLTGSPCGQEASGLPGMSTQRDTDST